MRSSTLFRDCLECRFLYVNDMIGEMAPVKIVPIVNGVERDLYSAFDFIPFHYGPSWISLVSPNTVQR